MPLNTPVDVDFGEDGNKSLDCFVQNNVLTLKQAYQNLHENLVPKWRRLAKGQPKDDARNFPWPNASNVVIPLIGENISVLKAVQISSIYEVLPIWVAGLVGEWEDSEQGDEQRRAYEDFMDLMALSTEELDLYRVESLAANDISEFGDAVIKAPWCTKVEAVVTGVNSEDRTKPIFDSKTIYDGPRPEKLDKQEWAATPTANTFAGARFKYHGPYKLSKDQVEEKIYSGAFDDNDATRKVLESPDREGLDTQKNEQLREQQNITNWNPNEHTAEWDFYECWFWYNHNDIKYRIIYTYHMGTKTRMKAIFNFYADNEEPFVFGRLGYDDDGLLGYGIAEMGEMFQEQVSTQHNQRNDNGTLQNTSIILTGRNTRLDSGFSVFPMACFPFDPSEFDIKSLGSGNGISNIDDEQLTIALAKSRFGTDMGMPSGSGAGQSSSKGKSGPSYSAQGTFSLLQTGTRRININVTDFRYMHLSLGGKLGRQYSDFGIGDRIKYFGKQGPVLQKALNALKSGRLNLPIKAATASINREVEKQTGMLFTQVMQRHFGTIAQIMQGLQNPMMKDMPEMREYLVGSISAMGFVMARLLRAFGYDDISRMQPELKFIKQLRAKEVQEQQQQRSQNGQQPVGSNAGTGGTEQGMDGASSGQGPGNGLIAPPGVQANSRPI